MGTNLFLEEAARLNITKSEEATQEKLYTNQPIDLFSGHFENYILLGSILLFILYATIIFKLFKKNEDVSLKKSTAHSIPETLKE